MNARMRLQIIAWPKLSCASIPWDLMNVVMHQIHCVNRGLVILVITLMTIHCFYCSVGMNQNPPSEDELSSIERTSLIIGGILVFLIAVLIALTIIIVVYIYMFAPRELYANKQKVHFINDSSPSCRAVERDTDGRRGNITHPRHMGLSLKEQRKMKGKKKKKVMNFDL